MKAKEEEISSQRIQILKLEHQLDHLYGQMNEMGIDHLHSHKIKKEPNGSI